MGEDLFSMDNILSGDEAASLFSDDTLIANYQEEKPEEKAKSKEKEENNSDIVEVKDSEELFGNTPESVGNEEQGKESTESVQADSPNFYSSITDALAEAGVFPGLTSEQIQEIKSSDDFIDLFNKRIKQELDERQKRIDEALSVGVESNVVRQYENTLAFLDQVTPEMIREEGDRGDDLRRRLLLQDFMNKNFSQENAMKMIKVLMDSGEDITQAALALNENKKFFKKKYDDIIASAKTAEQEEQKKYQEQSESLRKSIMSDEKLFGDMSFDKNMRQKIVDNIMKPSYKHPQTGEQLTALQKYRTENENDFIKNVGILFTLTDGFKNVDKLVQNTSKKEVKKKMQELEKTLSNSSKDSGGNLKYVGSSSQEASGKSFFDRGFTIDI